MDADVALGPPSDDPAHGFVRPRHLMSSQTVQHKSYLMSSQIIQHKAHLMSSQTVQHKAYLMSSQIVQHKASTSGVIRDT